jgi:hypothetical protein
MTELLEAQGSETSGQLRTENSMLRAQRIIAKELERLGWTGEQLAVRRKNDPAKLAIAARLRKGTTLTVKEISQRLHLGTANPPKRTCTVISMLPRAIQLLFPTKNSLQEYEGINHLTLKWT